MKKTTIITIMVTMAATMTVMATLGFGMIKGIKSEYETKLAEAKETYELDVSYIEESKDNAYADMKRSRDELYDKYNELAKEYAELEQQIYNVLEGEDYQIDIKHDGTYRSYELVHDQSTIGKLLGFAEESRTIID